MLSLIHIYSRSVNFNISINIRNTLNDLEVSFGLFAPEDLTMQNLSLIHI